ncbi:copper chaperone PCu(A)C [Afifella sp. IM 167]|uniref:copper chaperone PCu(A)C n=1 Tax=Afifella sp. IM 167 TaxID=2033586 RepID=UPI001CCF2702|nr:copper chaperone PCu(A)C [Afifella sp. IM 167]MBZ8134569.1 hypothetical protein [Afifella sp. IM 167]
MLKAALFALLAGAATLALPAPPVVADEHAPAQEEPGDHSHHEAELDGVHAVHAWTRATDADTALVFVDIENGSDRDVVLEGGESDIAEKVEIVGFVLKDGAPAWEPLPQMPLKAGRELKLAPNGLALRFTGVKEALHEGDEFEMEFHFDVGHLAMHVQVEAANAMHHSHAGHKH